MDSLIYFISLKSMEFYFILVKPSVPENVGASARSMKTMGFEKLRLVKPCDYLSIEAIKLAHGSKDILEKAEVYENLEDAIKDIDFIIGTSSKHRRVKYDYYPIEKIPEIIDVKRNYIKKCAILFGCEEYGLTNEELSLCHIISYIPMATKYPSLNLSHAVAIYAHRLFYYVNNKPKFKFSFKRNEESFNKLYSKLNIFLIDKGLTNTTLKNRILEKIAVLGEDDLKLIFSLLKYLDK